MAVGSVTHTPAPLVLSAWSAHTPPLGKSIGASGDGEAGDGGAGVGDGGGGEGGGGNGGGEGGGEGGVEGGGDGADPLHTRGWFTQPPLVGGEQGPTVLRLNQNRPVVEPALQHAGGRSVRGPVVPNALPSEVAADWHSSWVSGMSHSSSMWNGTGGGDGGGGDGDGGGGEGGGDGGGGKGGGGEGGGGEGEGGGGEGGGEGGFDGLQLR